MSFILDRINIAKTLPAPALPLVDEARGRERLAAIGDDSEALIDLLYTVSRQMEAECELLDVGGQRAVYQGQGVVYKVPCITLAFSIYYTNVEEFYYEYGECEPIDCACSPYQNIQANLIEALMYETEMVAPTVPCRIVWHESGIPILVMEEVDTQESDSPTDKPAKPVLSAVFENNQLGWSNLTSRWAGYDAGYPPFSIVTQFSRFEMFDHWHGLLTSYSDELLQPESAQTLVAS